MATFHFSGIDEYAAQLKKLNDKAEGMIKRAVYDGASVVLAAVISEISALPTIKNRYNVTDLPLAGVTETQKRGLINGVGLARMKNENGYVNTKLGFDGYNAAKSKKYPKGQPNALIARSVNSGSSARVKIPFINRAVKAAKAKAESAMTARFDADTNNMIK